MIFEIHRPGPPLDRVVEHIVYYAGFCPDHAREKLLPDGAVELIIDLTDTPKRLFDSQDLRKSRSFRQAWISGMRRDYIVIEAAQHSSMAVIRFRPGGAYRFLGFPVSEITDVVTEIEPLIGARARSLRDRLLEAPTAAEKFAAIEEFLLRSLRGAAQPNPVIGFLVERLVDPRDSRIGELIEQVGYSHKHVVALFKTWVGLTPKQFCRIRKFQQVVHRLEQTEDADLAALAQRCGYFDQAHFTNEFRRFSGLCPTTYLRSRGEYVNYLPLD